MGVTGLIPFLSESSAKAIKKATIRDFKGQTAAIDAYVLLHKGAYGSAKDLFEGKDTDKYVTYCMQYIDLLVVHNIKPIVVFDGSPLQAKAETEKERRNVRKQAKRKALELIGIGKTGDAYSQMLRAIDVTHTMALKLIKKCRSRKIDCIVAPYEADSQLTFLNQSGIADFVITEDSDLIVFGCHKIFFKLQLTGEGTVYDKSLLEGALSSKKIRCSNYSFEKFRIACILSGCDYLSSLPGIGLGKAWRFVSLTHDVDNLDFTLPKLGSYLNLKNLEVTKEYIEAVKIANGSFKHQIVYDPLTRTRRPIEEFHEDNCSCIITEATVGALNVENALERALGNIDPMFDVQMDSYNPDNDILPRRSIWKKDYKVNLDKKDYKVYVEEKQTAASPRMTRSRSSKNATVKTEESNNNENQSEISKEKESEDVSLSSALDNYKIDSTEKPSTFDECFFKDMYSGQCTTDEKHVDVEVIKKSNPFLKNKISLEKSKEVAISSSFLKIRNSPEKAESKDVVKNNSFSVKNSPEKVEKEKCPFKKVKNNQYEKVFVSKRKANACEYFSAKKSKLNFSLKGKSQSEDDEQILKDDKELTENEDNKIIEIVTSESNKENIDNINKNTCDEENNEEKVMPLSDIENDEANEVNSNDVADDVIKESHKTENSVNISVTDKENNDNINKGTSDLKNVENKDVNENINNKEIVQSNIEMISTLNDETSSTGIDNRTKSSKDKENVNDLNLSSSDDRESEVPQTILENKVDNDTDDTLSVKSTESGKASKKNVFLSVRSDLLHLKNEDSDDNSSGNSDSSEFIALDQMLECVIATNDEVIDLDSIADPIVITQPKTVKPLMKSKSTSKASKLGKNIDRKQTHIFDFFKMK